MIAWYIHHHGTGHVNRAVSVARELRTPVVGLSSRERPPGWPGTWIHLADDADVGDPEGLDVTAGATLHWAPLHHRGLRERMSAVSAVMGSGDIELLVADVSVEVSLLARLHGVPVVIMAQPGVRTDRAHTTAYDLAARLLAPWPEKPLRPGSASWAAKTSHLGAFSRYDGRPRTSDRRPEGRRVLVAWGSGGIDVSRDQLEAAARATPEWCWDVTGTPAADGRRSSPDNLHDLGWVDDLWPLLCRADVVVAHAGQNVVAEIAAARRPAVVIPQRRPFAEQEATADALRRAGIARVAPFWPTGSAWPGLLTDAAAVGGDGWQRWSTGDGAQCAATQLEALIAPGHR